MTGASDKSDRAFAPTASSPSVSPVPASIPCAWQPIETAPEGRDEFLGWCVCPDSQKGYLVIGRRWQGGGFISDEEGLIAPTHWMPMPPAPKVRGEA